MILVDIVVVDIVRYSPFVHRIVGLEHDLVGLRETGVPYCLRRFRIVLVVVVVVVSF